MEEYSSEEVYSLCFPTVRREYSSFGVEDWRSSLLSDQRSSLFSERSREREGLFVFFSNREDCFLEKANPSHQRSSLFFSTGIVVFSLRDSSSLFLFLWSIYVVYTLSFSVLSTSSRSRLDRVYYYAIEVVTNKSLLQIQSYREEEVA